MSKQIEIHEIEGNVEGRIEGIDELELKREKKN